MRELGRKYRGLYEEKKKESEELLAQKEVGDKQLEELKEASSKPPVEDVSVELRQQLETTKQVCVVKRFFLNDIFRKNTKQRHVVHGFVKK